MCRSTFHFSHKPAYVTPDQPCSYVHPLILISPPWISVFLFILVTPSLTSISSLNVWLRVFTIKYVNYVTVFGTILMVYEETFSLLFGLRNKVPNKIFILPHILIPWTQEEINQKTLLNIKSYEKYHETRHNVGLCYYLLRVKWIKN